MKSPIATGFSSGHKEFSNKCTFCLDEMLPNGAMVFGCLETTFLIRYGTFAFDGLHSIVAITTDGTIQSIGTEEYDRYAPAVMAIYEVIEQMPQ